MSKMRESVAVADQIESPELVLVSPPDLAARARAALPDYEVEYARWVQHVRSVAAANVPEPVPEPEPAQAQPLGGLAFIMVADAIAVAPLVLLILLR